MDPNHLTDFLRQRAVERFLRYVAVDTASNPDAEKHPSTRGQQELGAQLAEECRQLGLQHVEHDAHGYVYATFPAGPSRSSLTLTFCAHLDTSPSVSGTGVKPVIHRSYDGGPIDFSDAPGGTEVALRHVRFPSEEARANHEKGWGLILTALADAA